MNFLFNESSFFLNIMLFILNHRFQTTQKLWNSKYQPTLHNVKEMFSVSHMYRKCNSRDSFPPKFFTDSSILLLNHHPYQVTAAISTSMGSRPLQQVLTIIWINFKSIISHIWLFWGTKFYLYLNILHICDTLKVSLSVIVIFPFFLLCIRLP